MTEPQTSIPKTWTALIATARATPPGPIANFAYFYGRLLKFEITSPLYGTPFYRAAGALTFAAVLDPTPVVRSALDQLTGPARDICRSDAADLDRLKGQNLGALAVLTLEEAAGWGDPAGLTARPLDRLLDARHEARDTARQTIWASLAQGRTDAVAALLREDPATAPPDPGARFAGGVQPIQAHLARCLVAGDARAAEPAWRAYLDGFPVNLAIEEATWPELLWVARTVRVALGRAVPAGLLAWLRAEVAAAG